MPATGKKNEAPPNTCDFTVHKKLRTDSIWWKKVGHYKKGNKSLVGQFKIFFSTIFNSVTSVLKKCETINLSYGNPLTFICDRTRRQKC